MLILNFALYMYSQPWSHPPPLSTGGSVKTNQRVWMCMSNLLLSKGNCMSKVGVG